MNEREILELKAQEKLCKQAEDFIQSELGQFIEGCIKQDIEDAKADLVEVEPYKFKTLVDLQNEISLIQARVNQALSLRKYLSEAIVNGNQAIHLLDTGDTDDDEQT